jgi:hypothetical protein
MTVATYTVEQLSERIERGAARTGLTPTPMLRALTMLKKVADQANALGQQGHGVKEVEIIETREGNWSVRVVPNFKLKTPE